MLAGWRHGRIGQTRNHDIDVRMAGVIPVLGFVISALHVIEAGRD